MDCPNKKPEALETPPAIIWVNPKQSLATITVYSINPNAAIYANFCSCTPWWIHIAFRSQQLRCGALENITPVIHQNDFRICPDPCPCCFFPSTTAIPDS